MKTIQTLTATAIAAALSLPFAGAALADTTPAIDKTDTVMLAANTMDDAGDAASDTWITTKVKSTLLAEDATPGMDIEVETKDGVVSLSGTVATEAEKEAAIAKARGIEGVKDVSADGLKAVD
ncbi:BON domain-containing protein [Stutzerimonas sp. KH-1]|jgi:hyperosmotically inducible protein|uniref:BON domain-containing protein n=1 Tax=Stutzerimonas frequens TaxID=2968969 RepID=A0ABX6XV62_9GAMM|nr:BON domain-containing protein [Stutzerimonas frequens]TDL97625.1 BON domain-containing protein [Stutzerimonas stutzeri ATCC 17588 = LMG 11199]MCQ4303696.1 BON domain-containing protein [Stutzerimonas frequens]PNF51413.1 osmY [Stutzerimonas frequens]QPT17895.1 BON domain-containing protein [Stutzerimonas frequens]QTF56122.1 BON domain-containing protein [Stutzerimonas frequens]